MRSSSTIFFACLGLAGCEEPAVQPPEPANLAMSHAAPTAPRWYWPEQVAKGADLYLAYCAECHGENAEGTPNWRERGPDGKYPPPPLDGSAHTWHHPLAMLRQTVRIGGVPVGGSMPAFGDKLDNDEIDAILAWVQSHWSDQIYTIWRKQDAQSTSRLRFVEGHVPAREIRRMLDEKPDIRGLAVPGMPMGSPGMEGPRTDPYDVISFDKAGASSVYARY